MMDGMRVHIEEPKMRNAGCFICQHIAYYWVRVGDDMKNMCKKCVQENNLKLLIQAFHS